MKRIQITITETTEWRAADADLVAARIRNILRAEGFQVSEPPEIEGRLASVEGLRNDQAQIDIVILGGR
jgi:hypothetical protein